MSQRHLRSTDQDVSHWLIRRAARAAPESLSARLEEEWLADLAARPSATSRLRFAIGCCWATRVIADEHQPAPVALGAPVATGKGLAAFADQHFGFLSPRSRTFVLVASLHAVLLYGLMHSLSHTHAIKIPEPLQNQEVKSPVVHEPPVKLADPRLNPVAIEIQRPETELAYEADRPELTTSVDPQPQYPPPTEVAPPPQPPVSRVAGGPGAGFPNAEDFYPQAARRLQEQGMVSVQVCVDTKGRLTSDPTTLQSAGSPRLDEGALKLARAGSGHYRATLEDGHPVDSCYPVRIRFQLQDAR